MKVNGDKNNLLMSGNKKANSNIDKNYIKCQDVQKIFGTTINRKFMFENHINKPCKKKEKKKLNFLAGISNYMTFDKENS